MYIYIYIFLHVFLYSCPTLVIHKLYRIFRPSPKVFTLPRYHCNVSL